MARESLESTTPAKGQVEAIRVSRPRALGWAEKSIELMKIRADLITPLQIQLQSFVGARYREVSCFLVL